MLRNSYIRFMAAKRHNCHCTVDVQPKETYANDDSLFYVWNESTRYVFYKCSKVMILNKGKENERCLFRATRIESHPVYMCDMDMAKVGVHRYHCLTDIVRDVDRDDMTGKAMKVTNLIMSIPNGTVEEMI
jgi:hypothetical protein